MQRIASRAHPAIRRLRGLRRKKERRARACYLAEGPHLALEALAATAPVLEAAVSPRLQRNPEHADLGARLARAGATVYEVTDAVLDSIADAGSHQGVVLAVAQAVVEVGALVARADRLVVAIGVQEPGNVGALARVAEALGGDGLIACGGADPWNPKAVRAAAGSLFRLPLALASDAACLRSQLRASAHRVVATAPRGGRPPGRLEGRVAILIGGEGAGLSSADLDAADDRVSVAVASPVESLNVVTAAAIVLFAAAWNGPA